MKRIIGINKIDRLRKKHKRPLIKSCTGQLLPDFREQNKSGFDVTNHYNEERLKNDSDILKLLHIVNNYCPVAHIGHVYNMDTQMTVYLGDIELHIELRSNKIISTRISRPFGSGRKPINILYEGNDIEKVFHDKIVRNNSEYVILRRELLMQYSI
jgi:hypothetical protein